MVPAPVRLAAVVIALTTGLPAAARQDADPEYDGKKASEWVNILQSDTSARKRAVAAVALGNIWAKHRYVDALEKGVGRSLQLDSSAAVRAQCAVVVAGLKPEDAAKIEKYIVDAFKEEKDARVRKELATAAGRFPDVAKKTVEPLIVVLKDTDPAARAVAADALAKAGPEAKAAAPVLLPLLDDPDKAVRQAAVFALGRITPDNASFVAAALVKRFGEEKEPELRRDVLVALKLLGDKSELVITALAGALTDPDDDIRAVAVHTLGTFGPAAKPAADAILKLATGAKNKDLRIDAVRAFGSVLGPGLKDRVNDVIRVMETDPDFEVRLTAVEELAALGNAIKDDKDTMTALRKRLSDPQVKVREAAAVAIRRIERKPEPKTPEKKP